MNCNDVLDLKTLFRQKTTYFRSASMLTLALRLKLAE